MRIRILHCRPNEANLARRKALFRPSLRAGLSRKFLAIKDLRFSNTLLNRADLLLDRPWHLGYNLHLTQKVMFDF